MENDWVVVYTTQSPYEAEIIHGMLGSNGVDSVIINKRDSSYGVFGDVLVYVHQDHAEKAADLIRQSGEKPTA